MAAHSVQLLRPRWNVSRSVIADSLDGRWNLTKVNQSLAKKVIHIVARKVMTESNVKTWLRNCVHRKPPAKMEMLSPTVSVVNSMPTLQVSFACYLSGQLCIFPSDTKCHWIQPWFFVGRTRPTMSSFLFFCCVFCVYRLQVNAPPLHEGDNLTKGGHWRETLKMVKNG